MKIKLPYLSEITIVKKTLEKDVLCLNSDFFDLEEVSGDDIFINNSIIKKENYIDKKNYLSLCSIDDFEKLFQNVVDNFVSDESLMNNLFSLVLARDGKNNTKENFDKLEKFKTKIFLEKSKEIKQNNPENLPAFFEQKYNFHKKLDYMFMIIFYLLQTDNKNMEKKYISNDKLEKFKIVHDDKEDISDLNNKFKMLKIHNGQICIPEIVKSHEEMFKSIKHGHKVNIDILKNIIIHYYLFNNYFRNHKFIQKMETDDIELYLELRKSKYFILNQFTGLEFTSDYFDLLKFIPSENGMRNLKVEERKLVDLPKVHLSSCLQSDIHNDKIFEKVINSEKFKEFYNNSKYEKYLFYDELIEYIKINENTKVPKP